MPFVHLERDLWDLRDAVGQEIGPDAPERRAWLLDRGAVGRLRAPVERLLADPKTLAAAARLLLDLHFTPALAEMICAAVDLDVPALDLAATGGPAQAARLRPRRRGFAEEVLRAYAYQCAMCGFDGALGRYPVGIEAAHVRWHSQQGPDEIANALALCALHPALSTWASWASPKIAGSACPASTSPEMRRAWRWMHSPVNPYSSPGHSSRTWT